MDVLTGEKNVVRTDIIQDTGVSMSPEIDLGQIEGGFIMSLGLWTSEQIKFDQVTGRLLTKDTWVMTKSHNCISVQIVPDRSV